MKNKNKIRSFSIKPFIKDIFQIENYSIFQKKIKSIQLQELFYLVNILLMFFPVADLIISVKSKSKEKEIIYFDLYICLIGMFLLFLIFCYLFCKYKKKKHKNSIFSHYHWLTNYSIFIEILIAVHLNIPLFKIENPDLIEIKTLNLFFYFNIKIIIMSFLGNSHINYLYFSILCYLYLFCGFYFSLNYNRNDFILFFINIILLSVYIILIFFSKKRIKNSKSIPKDTNFDLVTPIFNAFPDGIFVIEDKFPYKMEYTNKNLFNLLELSNNELNFSDLISFDSIIQHYIKEYIKLDLSKLTYTEKIPSYKEGFLNLKEIIQYLINPIFQEIEMGFMGLRTNSDNINYYIELFVKKIKILDGFKFLLIFRSLKNQEKILIQSKKNDFKSRLLCSFSHELKTPLNGAIPNLEMMLLEKSVPERFREINIKNSLCSLKLLNSTLNDIIDFSLIYSDQLIINFERIKLESLLEDINELVLPLSRAKKLNYKVIISDIKIVFTSDYNRLKQILVNLLKNAIQFTSEGEISLNITKNIEKKSLLFSVNDTGIGMSIENLNFLQNFLSQVENLDGSLELNSTGGGLGLIVTQNLANLLGFEGNKGLIIDSKLGEGSKFSFYIMDRQEMIKPLSHLDIKEDISQNFNSCPQKEQISVNSPIGTSNNNLTWFNSIKIEYIRQNNLNERIAEQSSSLILCFNEASENFEDRSKNTLEFTDKLNELDFNRKVKFVNQLNQNISSNKQIVSNLKSRSNLDSIDLMENIIDEIKINCDCARVLIVDDDIFNLLSLEMLLKSLNYKCEKAMNGVEAIELLKNRFKPIKKCCKGFELVFMDYQMPIMDGVEATKKIINLINIFEIPKIPIIGCTAFVSKNEILKCFDSGMKDVLFKPLTRKKLECIMSKWLPL